MTAGSLFLCQGAAARTGSSLAARPCWPQPTLPPLGSSGSPAARAGARTWSRGSAEQRPQHRVRPGRLQARPGGGPGKVLGAHWIHRAGLRRPQEQPRAQSLQAWLLHVQGQLWSPPWPVGGDDGATVSQALGLDFNRGCGWLDRTLKGVCVPEPGLGQVGSPRPGF